jgi:hypothetical protein
MLATVPTTLAGIRALAEYAATEDVELEGLPGGVEALSALPLPPPMATQDNPSD